MKDRLIFLDVNQSVNLFHLRRILLEGYIYFKEINVSGGYMQAYLHVYAKK